MIGISMLIFGPKDAGHLEGDVSCEVAKHTPLTRSQMR